MMVQLMIQLQRDVPGVLVAAAVYCPLQELVSISYQLIFIKHDHVIPYNTLA